MLLLYVEASHKERRKSLTKPLNSYNGLVEQGIVPKEISAAAADMNTSLDDLYDESYELDDNEERD